MKNLKQYESWRFYWKFFVVSVLIIPATLRMITSESILLNALGLFISIIWFLNLCARLSVIFSNSIEIVDKKLVVCDGYRKTVVPIENIVDISVQQSINDKRLGIGGLLILTKFKNLNCCVWRMKHPQKIKKSLLEVRNYLQQKKNDKSIKLIAV